MFDTSFNKLHMFFYATYILWIVLLHFNEIIKFTKNPVLTLYMYLYDYTCSQMKSDVA